MIRNPEGSARFTRPWDFHTGCCDCDKLTPYLKTQLVMRLLLLLVALLLMVAATMMMMVLLLMMVMMMVVVVLLLLPLVAVMVVVLRVVVGVAVAGDGGTLRCAKNARNREKTVVWGNSTHQQLKNL